MTKKFTKTLVAEAVIFAIAVCSILPTVSAAKLDLPAAPLSTSTSIQPNMMLFIDSSGSMEYIVEDSSEYDKDNYNYICTKKLSNAQSVRILITAEGEPYFYSGNNSNNYYQFGTTKNEKCFDNDLFYNAELYAAKGNSLKSTTNYTGAKYNGKFLNWYFEGSNFSKNSRKRDNTETRIEVARAATISLLDSLDNINVGLSQFDGGDGAKIIANITDINTAKSTLKSKVPYIDAGSGGTPLAEALQEIARYFTLGYSPSSNLTIHPEQSGEALVKTSDLFKQNPIYSSGLSAPSEVTTQWCQQNFLVALTDGQPSNDQDNFSSYLQDYDGDCSDNSCNNYDKKKSGGYNYESSGSDYADDVILAMHDIDLRPDLVNGSESVKNNVTTYIVSFAEEALASDPLILDMATAGGGGALLTAANSTELIAAFKSATDSIFAKTASGSGVSFNTSQLTSDSSIYAASFDSGDWSGSLKAYDLSTTGTIQTETWDAAAKLDALTDYKTRNVFSYNSLTKKGIVFNDTNIDSDFIADLNKGPLEEAGLSSLINYLKGDMLTNIGTETTNYRERVSRLGDIVNSTVVNVGAPELKWPDYNSDNTVTFGGTGKNYSDFKKISRTEMLYVGANDGMLHGFIAADGEEKFAYIPRLLSSTLDKEGLHYLAAPDYEHRFYVDSTPTVSDVYFNNNWHTVLVGGLRSGGKGLFALDITDPTKFDATDANAQTLSLWEFGSNDDPDFGYSYSEPTIAKMANGEWAVIVGNGYNNNGDGHAKLFIIYLDKNGQSTWSNGNNYIVIDTGVGSTSTPNGLSTPRAVDLNGDSVIDRIYAGDLLGNMWAIDVSNSSDGEWKIAHQDTGSAVPLFTAKIGSTAQPITTAPIVANNTNPESASGTPNILVFFGTGKYIEKADKTSTDLMSYYGVLDNGTGSQTRTKLTPRELYSTSTTRVISGLSISWLSSRGWYFDFEDQVSSSATPTNIGERVISNSLITNNVLLFNTIIPKTAQGDLCTSDSESWIMAVDLNTGKAPNYTVFDVDGNGVFDDKASTYDINNDGKVDTEDLTSHAGVKVNGSMIAGDIGILGNKVYSNDVDGNLNTEAINIEKTNKQGRLSWEELFR